MFKILERSLMRRGYEKTKEILEWNKVGGGVEFDELFRWVNRCLDGEEKLQDPDRAIVFLDYIINAVAKDLKYEWITDLFKQEERGGDYESSFFPDYFYDESQERYSFHTECFIGQTHLVSLERDTVVSLPWKRERIIDTYDIGKIRSFKQDDSNHEGQYYIELGLSYVHNGRHSVTAGSSNHQGTLVLPAYSLENLFPHVESDGTKWINAHTKEELRDGFLDYRIGILYELAKIKWNVEKRDKEGK